MQYKELYETVKAKLPRLAVITTIFIQMRYHCLQSDARRCVAQLQEEGLVGKDWDATLGGFLVLKVIEKV